MDNITKFKFSKIFNVDRLVTLFYMEVSKDFRYDGERHDFWEMVYIDKGEMLCTAKDSSHVLKNGELTGDYLIAVDSVGAGINEEVLITTGSSARLALQNTNAPCDAVIVGIID